MTTIVITPAAPLLTAAQARSLVPQLAGETDARLELLLATAQAEIDPPHSLIGRAFGEQTLEHAFHGCAWRLEGRARPQYRDGALPLPFPPLRSIVSVTYDDPDGASQTLAPEAYRVETVNGIPLLVPAATAWPEVASGPSAIRVRYVAGYSEGAPELARARYALVLMAQDLRLVADEDLFLKRETTEGIGTIERAPSPQARQILTDTAQRLLAPLRVWL